MGKDLDFSFFREESEQAPARTESGQNSTTESKVKVKKHVETLKPVESTLAPSNRTEEQANALAIKNRARSHEEEEARRVYKTYQENIRKSVGLTSEILKGAQVAEDSYSLLLKACKVISLMTGDTVFYSSMDSVIRNVYGLGLQEPQPIELEIEQIRARLKKLGEAQEREQAHPEARERIADSIKAHQRRAAELKRLIDRQG